MADKESTLAIVIRTVDKTTAGLNAFSAKIKALGVLAAPVQLIGERLGALGRAAGIPQVASAIGGVGTAAKQVFGRVQSALLGMGLSVGLVAHEVFSLVEHFDDLGDKSERLGVTNDFLASMRYAAEKAGAPVGALDEGMQAFVQNLGQARANGGRMLKFLQTVSPALAQQLVGAKSNEQAFRLLAQAMAKITDPAKRAALAQKTVGDPALAPLLAKGADGLYELQGAYIALAGSQEDAAEGAGSVDDSLHDLHAATDGVKAALVTGLSPALKKIIEQLTEWLVSHREDIRRWADDIGQKLPGAVKDLVEWLDKAYGKVTGFVEAIGGWKVAAAAIAAVIAGPLITSVVSLGAAILATPIGWILAGVAALTIGIVELVKHWDDLTDAISRAIKATVEFLGIGQDEQRASAKLTAAAEGIDLDQYAPEPVPPMAAPPTPVVTPVESSLLRSRYQGDVHSILDSFGQRQTETRIKVDFANAPRGTRVTADPRSTADVDLSVGYQMGGL